MPPNLERAAPPYVQIAERIRQDIESGALADGATIPSAREITATWGVALATATKVHARLRAEGLIEAVPGVGTIVSARRSARGGLERLTSTHSRGLIYGVNERAVILSAELVEAPAAVADALGVEAGSPVVRRERQVRRDDQPSSVSVSWLPGSHVDQAPSLLSIERVRQGTFAYLAGVLGVTVTSGREQTSASTATAGQAQGLGVDPGSPVLLTRTWFYADDLVIEYGESIHPAGRWLTHDFTLG